MSCLKISPNQNLEKVDISLSNTDLVLVITDNETFFKSINVNNKILIKNFNDIYNLVLNHLFIHDDCLEYVDDFDYKDGSYISKFSYIDPSAIIQKNCTIGRGVKLGKNVIIKNNTVIKNAIICDNSIISENSTIGH